MFSTRTAHLLTLLQPNHSQGYCQSPLKPLIITQPSQVGERLTTSANPTFPPPGQNPAYYSAPCRFLVARVLAKIRVRRASARPVARVSRSPTFVRRGLSVAPRIGSRARRMRTSHHSGAALRPSALRALGSFRPLSPSCMRAGISLLLGELLMHMLVRFGFGRGFCPPPRRHVMISSGNGVRALL